MTEQLRETRETATNAKIALRHAEDAAADYLTWFNSSVDYDALGKNAKSRELAFNELLAKDGRAINFEKAVRAAQDAKDMADFELECLFDDIKADNARTWATLADWVRGRTTSGRMGSPEHAGQEILKEQVEGAVDEDWEEWDASFE